MKLRDALVDELGREELKLVPRSFDIIGSREGAVTSIQIPEELHDRRGLIGEAVMRLHKNVRSVLARTSSRKGVYRTREYEVIAGEPDTEVVHREHGLRYRLDPRKVYFSPREGAERLRVASQVVPGERVLVMFAGVGPYALMIARVQPRVGSVVAIEINREAYEYMLTNIRMNRASDKVVAVLGDVRDRASEWFGTCSRVVMPLPKGGRGFLSEAFNSISPEGGVLHFYHWAREESLFEEAVDLVEGEARRKGRRARFLLGVRVLPYSPRVYKVCVDFAVE